MTASEDMRKRGTRKKMAILFLPRTLPARLAALGFIFTGIGATIPTRFDSLLETVGGFVLILAFVLAVRDSLQRKGRRTAGVFRLLVVTGGLIAGYYVLYESVRLLAFMAAGGSGSFRTIVGFSSASPTSSGAVGGVESWLLFFSIVLLVWIPEVFFRIKLDVTGTGDAQRVLLGLITVATCAATGVFILLLHFGHGPLSTINLGTLVVGIIATMFLVAPPYRSLARVCWRRGIAGVFSPRVLKQHWGNMATELAKALKSATERDMPPSNNQSRRLI